MTAVSTGQLRAVSPLEPRRWLLIGVVLLPVPITAAAFIVVGILTGRSAAQFGLPSAYLLYGLANLSVLAGVYALLTPPERSAVFRFRRPSARELAWTVGAFPVGIGVFLATDGILSAFGFTMGGLSYSLADPLALLAVVVGAVIVAPITEEVFYRGLVLGKLLAHGVGAATAVAAMTVLFGLIHLPTFGVTGTVFTAVWGLLPAVLRLRFDNLSGAVLLHVINNTWAYLVVVGLGLY